MKVRVFASGAACAAIALALVACRDSSAPEPPEQFSYAIFNADVEADESGALTTSPVGYFFRAGVIDLPTSEGTQDACQLQRIGAPGTDLPEFINAGDSISFATAGSSTIFLKPTTVQGLTSYGASDETPVGLDAGANATFTVPGAADGFPASEISVQTVVPYEMSPVPADLPVGQNVTLTWTDGGDATSKVDVAFSYSTNGNVINEQLYCTLVDDGEFTVPASSLVGYRAAVDGVRQFASRRWRSSFKNLGGSSVMLAVSSYFAPIQTTR